LAAFRAFAASGLFLLQDVDVMKEIKVTLKKSYIGSTQKIRATLIGLGLTKTNKTVVRKDTPEIRGMINKVAHLVEVED
jgi:large subunit ribosomal protein L30